MPLVQLFSAQDAKPYDFVVSGDPRTYGDLATPAGLREVARYADGVGPSKDYIVPRSDRLLARADDVRARCAPRRTGRAPVHVPGGERVPALRAALVGDPDRHGDLEAEVRQFFELGVDGVFVDHPDYAVDARDDD